MRDVMIRFRMDDSNVSPDNPITAERISALIVQTLSLHVAPTHFVEIELGSSYAGDSTGKALTSVTELEPIWHESHTYASMMLYLLPDRTFRLDVHSMGYESKRHESRDLEQMLRDAHPDVSAAGFYLGDPEGFVEKVLMESSYAWEGR